MAEKTFDEKLSELPEIDNIVLGRVYDSDGNLLTIVPNLPGKAKSLRAFNGNQVASEHINLKKALETFDQKTIDEAINEGKHPNVRMLLNAIEKGKLLKLSLVKSENPNLLEKIVEGDASSQEKLEGLKLMEAGKLRTAEKTYGVDLANLHGMWEPQQYAIDTMNGAFGLFEMGKFPGMGQYADKIPLWSQDVEFAKRNDALLYAVKILTNEKIDFDIQDEKSMNELIEAATYGVKSRFRSEEELIESGVRLIPGSFARKGSYIGPGTTIMPGGIVNIGAYIAGNGVMIDGGARAASGVQVGEGVKIGAGTGLEGVLEPAGMMPTIVEDNVRIGANCEVTGIIGEGSLIASGVVMAAGKKIYDEITGEFHKPYLVETAEGIRAVPHIPANRIAVGGTYIPDGSNVGKDIVVLLDKWADESDFMEVPKNFQLYVRN